MIFKIKEIVDVKNISVEKSNSNYLLNQTYNMLKTEEITVDNIEVVSNLLHNISEISEVSAIILHYQFNFKTNLNKFKANQKTNLVIKIFDELLISANKEKSETLLNTTQK